MTTFSILTADSPLLDELIQIVHKQWGHEPGFSSIEKIKERILQRINSADSEFILISTNEDNQLLGTASVMLYELDDKVERRYWMGEVIIQPLQRGKGLGTALVREILRYSEQYGISELFLYTPDQQPLYRKLGWQEIEQRCVYGEQVSIMQRAITIIS